MMDGRVGGRSRGAAKEGLRARWGRWTAIVEAFARRRPSRRSVDPADYRALRRDLLADCRAAAEATDAGSPTGLEDLESLVRPWLCPETLARADREILEGLLARCREVERRLGGRGWRPALRVAARLAPPSVAVAGLCALGALALATGPAREWVRDWSDLIWFAARRSSDIQRLAVVAAVVIYVSIRAVSRAARS